MQASAKGLFHKFTWERFSPLSVDHTKQIFAWTSTNSEVVQHTRFHQNWLKNLWRSEGQGHSNWYQTAEFTGVFTIPCLRDISFQMWRTAKMLLLLFLFLCLSFSFLFHFVLLCLLLVCLFFVNEVSWAGFSSLNIDRMRYKWIWCSSDQQKSTTYPIPSKSIENFWR